MTLAASAGTGKTRLVDYLAVAVHNFGSENIPVSVRPVQVSVGTAEDDEDEELSAYNAYLARLNNEVKRHGRWHGLRS